MRLNLLKAPFLPFARASELLALMEAHTDPLLKNPLCIRPADKKSRASSLDIPIHQDAYEYSNFKINEAPLEYEGCITIKNVEVGYTPKTGQFMSVTRLSYITFNPSSGNVLEFGVPSHEAGEIFLEHIFPKPRSEEEKRKIGVILRRLYDDLKLPESPNFEDVSDLPESNNRLRRETDYSRKKLKEFIDKRGWPEDVVTALPIIHLDRRRFPLLRWGEQYGFTPKDLFHAGLCDRVVSSTGEVTYSPKDVKVTKNLFIHPDGLFYSARTRQNIRKIAEEKKYTSHPLDRSKDALRTTYEKVFNALSLLKESEWLITVEGEYKASVVETVTGIPCVGILGITDYDKDFLLAICKGEQKKHLTLLDSDPTGAGFSKGTGTTDSQRASYWIARKLELLGKESYIGIVPRSSGSKAGADDYLLEIPEEDRAKLFQQQVIETAKTPSQYAEYLGLDQTMLDARMLYDDLKRALRDYRRSQARGGPNLPDDTVQEIESMLRDLRSIEQEHLWLDRWALGHEHGDKQVGFPIFPSTVPNREKKLLVDEAGELIKAQKFEGGFNILFIYPDDLDDSLKVDSVRGVHLPIEINQLLIEFQTCSISDRTKELLERGKEALPFVGARFDSQTNASKDSYLRDAILLVYVGALQAHYPIDSYRYRSGVNLYERQEYGYDLKDTMRLVLERKGTGSVAAVCVPPIWLEPTFEAQVRAIEKATRQRLNFVAFVKENKIKEGKQDRIQRIVQTLVDHATKGLKKPNAYKTDSRLETLLPALGISPETAARDKLGYIFNHENVIHEFRRHGQLRDAAFLGVILDADQGGRIRFNGPTVVLPELDSKRNVLGVRFAPLDLKDHFGHLPPLSRLVYRLDPRAQARAKGSPIQTIYRAGMIPDSPGKLWIAQDELSALLIQTVLDQTNNTSDGCIGLNGHLRIPPPALTEIKSLNPKRVSIVAYPRPTPFSILFKPESVIPNIVELIRLREQFNSLGVETDNIDVAFLSAGPNGIFRRAHNPTGSLRDFTNRLQKFFKESIDSHLIPAKHLEDLSGIDKDLIFHIERLTRAIEAVCLHIESGCSNPVVGFPDLNSALKAIRVSFKFIAGAMPDELEFKSLEELFQGIFSLDNPMPLESIIEYAKKGPPLTFCRGVIYSRSSKYQYNPSFGHEQFEDHFNHTYGGEPREPERIAPHHAQWVRKDITLLLQKGLAIPYLASLQDYGYSLMLDKVAIDAQGRWKLRLRLSNNGAEKFTIEEFKHGDSFEAALNDAGKSILEKLYSNLGYKGLPVVDYDKIEALHHKINHNFQLYRTILKVAETQGLKAGIKVLNAPDIAYEESETQLEGSTKREVKVTIFSPYGELYETDSYDPSEINKKERRAKGPATKRAAERLVPKFRSLVALRLAELGFIEGRKDD